jgi:hypothetical protein
MGMHGVDNCCHALPDAGHCVRYCMRYGVVRLSHTSFNEMFCILMRCLSCHRAGLSVVHTHIHTQVLLDLLTIQVQ